MKRYLFILALPFLLATCKDNDVSPNNPVVGRWSLVARQDSTGKWNAFIPLVPVIVEFRRDFSVDYITTDGEPQRGCCQPTHYSFAKPTPCPINASCLQTAGTIRFDAWVICENAYCALPQTWTTSSVDEVYLDIYATPANRSVNALRYQRIN